MQAFGPRKVHGFTLDKKKIILNVKGFLLKTKEELRMRAIMMALSTKAIFLRLYVIFIVVRL